MELKWRHRTLDISGPGAMDHWGCHELCIFENSKFLMIHSVVFRGTFHVLRNVDKCLLVINSYNSYVYKMTTENL